MIAEAEAGEATEDRDVVGGHLAEVLTEAMTEEDIGEVKGAATKTEEVKEVAI